MHTIEQRKLGKSGLAVPALGIGIWSWGETGWWNYGQSHTHDDVIQAYRTCLDAGFTFFDTAEVYGNGASERLLGECRGLDGRSITIASKFAPPLTRFSRAKVAHFVKTEKSAKLRATFLLFRCYSFFLCPPATF